MMRGEKNGKVRRAGRVRGVRDDERGEKNEKLRRAGRDRGMRGVRRIINKVEKSG